MSDKLSIQDLESLKYRLEDVIWLFKEAEKGPMAAAQKLDLPDTCSSMKIGEAVIEGYDKEFTNTMHEAQHLMVKILNKVAK